MDLTAAYGFRMDWIVSFVAVARHGGFSAAAKATFRSQSRISEHLAELEKAVGVQLFPARLTPEGRALVPHAEEILNRLNDLASAGGEVRFGTYPSAAAWLFPQVVRRLPAEIRLHLVEGPSIDLEGALGRGDVDLAIRPVHPLVASEWASVSPTHSRSPPPTSPAYAWSRSATQEWSGRWRSSSTATGLAPRRWTR